MQVSIISFWIRGIFSNWLQEFNHRQSLFSFTPSNIHTTETLGRDLNSVSEEKQGGLPIIPCSAPRSSPSPNIKVDAPCSLLLWSDSYPKMLQINPALICFVLRFLINPLLKHDTINVRQPITQEMLCFKKTVSIVGAWTTNIKLNSFKNLLTKRRSHRSCKELSIKNLHNNV